MKEKKKILNCALLLAIVIVAGYIALNIFIGSLFKTPTELQKTAVMQKTNKIFKKIFAENNKIGYITDIVIGELDSQPGEEIGFAGTKGALLLDRNKLEIKKEVLFEMKGRYVSIIDVENDGNCEFMIREGDIGNRKSALLNHYGKILWVYKDSSGINDMAAGDVNGDGEKEFIVGFNGAGGVHLLDKNGKIKWKYKDKNVWHVEMVDIDNDGLEEIVYSKTGSYLVIRGQDGQIVSKNRVSVHFSDFSITRWPDKASDEYILLAGDEMIWIVNFRGEIKVQYPAPRSRSVFGYAKGTPLKLRSDKGIYYAVLIEFRHWRRAILYIYDDRNNLVYTEIFPEACSSIAAMSTEDKVEKLLVGCKGKVWEYSIIE